MAFWVWVLDFLETCIHEHESMSDEVMGIRMHATRYDLDDRRLGSSLALTILVSGFGRGM